MVQIMFSNTPENPAYERCLDLLDKKPLSANELRDTLEQGLFSTDQIDQALDKARDYGYLDDFHLGTKLLEEANRKKKGWLWLRKKLMQRQIESDVVDQLAKISRENAYELARENLDNKRRYKSLSRTQAYRFLLNRGFEIEVVQELIQAEYRNYQHLD